MKILVLECDWGAAERGELRKLLMDTASHINEQMRCPFDGSIEIVNSPKEQTPRIYYRRCTGGCIYKINMTARDRYWVQFAYQFAHEFCHTLSRYEDLECNPNQWFHESICELASLFTLRRMGERWRSNPPYPNWANYAISLTDYAEGRIACSKKDTPADSEFADWLLSYEDLLQRDPYLLERRINNVVAAKLLPLFEEHPQGWNAITRFPTSESRIPEYLTEWHSSVDPADQPFVAGLIEELLGKAKMGVNSP